MELDDLYTTPERFSLDDRLFGDRGQWSATAQLDGPFFGDWRYVEGFRRAAEVLCAKAMRSPGDVAALAMPALYCYRHWAELRLKDLWLLSARYRCEEVDPRMTHDLVTLWKLVRPILEPMGPPEGSDELDALEAVLMELAQDGPRAEGFRYAKTHTGEPTLPPELTRVNLANVREVMAKASAILDGSASMLAQAIQDGEDAARDAY